MYKFKLPIGDWSNDGHEQCNYFIVESNKSVEEVREIHFKIKPTLGLDIHSICGKYEENTIKDENYRILKHLEFKDWDDYKEYAWMSSDMMADLWIFLLKAVDPSLNISIVPDDMPMLPFYGYDEKGRHIGYVGYGCFW